tara:strand:+ start:42 stop:530 length:489 start_codon:yes stop_codon:yes gene_type:complete
MYLSLNLPTLETKKIKWDENKLIDRSSNSSINVNGKLGYWSYHVDNVTYKKLQKFFPEEILLESRVLIQFLRSSVNDNPHRDSYPWTFMYMLDDADGYTNLYNDNKEITSSHVTQKGKWALLKSWDWHSPDGISGNKIRKALVIRIKKDFDLNFLLESTNVA